MLKCLYTISEQYKNKKIVIYGINRSSIVLFTDLVLNHQADIDLFWDADDRFTGEFFVNRQIVNTEQLQKIDEMIVIIPEVFDKQEIQREAGKDVNVFYPDEILKLNQELRNEKIYVYGIGHCGEIIYDQLLSEQIEVEGICVTNVGRIGKWCGRDVLSVEQIEQGDNCSVILATKIEKYQKEMLQTLENFDVVKYVKFFIQKDVITEGNFFQVINLALTQNKNIWLYNGNNLYLLYLQDILARYQINISKIICEDSIFDLEYEDIDNISVLIADNDETKTEWACDTLDSMGFALEQWNYAAIRLYTFNSIWRATIKKDVLIGNSVLNVKKYPGYVVYGDEKTARVKIMILGGSTSTDNIYRTVSWVNSFYKKLLEVGCDAMIFNGAVCSHGIVDEFLHMLRDIEPLKPDYVISFSGVNNTYHRKTANQFNIFSAEAVAKSNSDCISGIESNEEPYDFWRRIVKLMQLVAAQYGIKAYNFLQPMSMANEKMDLIGTAMFDYTEHTKYMRSFKARALKEKEHFYYNLISLFEKNEKAYIDHCHYSTEANKIIAQHVFDVIIQDIEENIGKGK